jgi:hypothetical protein
MLKGPPNTMLFRRNRNFFRTSLVSFSAAALLLGAGVSFGCKGEEESSTSTESDAGSASAGPAVDPNIAKAMAMASAASQKPGRPSESTKGGPPPGGIFEPGQADQQIRVGEPPKIVVGSNGSEPRTLLTSGFKPGAKVKGSVQVALQGDPSQGAIPINFDLVLTTAGEKKAAQDPAAASSAAPAAAASGVDVSVSIERATVVAPSGSVPPDVAGQVAKLKGGKVKFHVLPNGAASGFVHTLPAGADVWLNDVTRMMSDALATAVLPYPSEAVGSGAYWMVTSRDGLMGLDLVTYRMIKVESATPAGLSLSLNTKRYATSREFKLSGIEGDYTLDQFQSTADGDLTLKPGAALPESGKFAVVLLAALVPKTEPQRQAQMQLQARVRLDFPGQ